MSQPNGSFKLRIHTIGVGNHGGKLSKIAKRCRAGVSIDGMGTGSLYWLQLIPPEIRLDDNIDTKSPSDVFKAIVAHLDVEELAEIRKENTRQILVSFALETTDTLYYAIVRPAPIALGSPNSEGGAFVNLMVSEEESDVVSAEPLLLWFQGWEKSFLVKPGKPKKLSKKESREIRDNLRRASTPEVKSS